MKLVLFVFYLTILSVFAQNSNDAEEFIATDQWQKIREGQRVPPGLHIRLNLETGEREAKLLDPNEKSTSDVIATPSEISQEEISRTNLEKAFANLDLTRDDVQNEIDDEEIRRKFRPYEELKKDFEEMNLKVQTDQEIIKDLIEKLNRTNDNDERQTILTDLEYFLHQYDNGIFFADNNGLTLLLQYLNSTELNTEIRKSTCLVLGAAFQGNPQVQLKGLHLGFVQSLIRLIHDENDEQLKIRLIYPLSTLLRNFPPGQKQFLDYGGAETMKNLLDSSRASNQLAIRTMTLMNDLIVEKRQATDGRKIAYENLRLFDELVERGWCSALVNRLELLDLKSFDFVEKILDVFLSFRDECRKDFEIVRPIFNEIDEIYSKLNVDEESLYDEILQNLSFLREISTRKSSEEL